MKTYITLLLASIIIVSCNDVQNNLRKRAHEELDKSEKIIDRNLEKIQEEKKRIEELEESWRIEDSIAGRTV